ncbi:MAG TPA: thioredoxin fold domain-containing protein [Thermoanaerobaculia bacterium]|nr:thioredoxin fold domain-containing protein [Thermoanaerobaculia bacterium]
MSKRILLLAAVATLLTQQAFAGPWLKSLATAKKKAKEQNELIFVDLFADWCGWCHKMEQEVFPAEAFQKATDNKVLLRLNTEDGGEGTKLAQQYDITSLPTFLLLTADGSIAGTIRGYFPADQFVHVLADTEKGYRDFEKEVAQESSITTDYQKRLELARAFRTRYALGESEKRFRKLVTEAGVPSDVRDTAYYELALTQAVQKHYDDALTTVKKFATVANKGESYEKALLLAGDIYVQQGNYKLALTEFKNFKEKFPKSQYIANIDVVLPQLEQHVKQ